MRLVTWNVLHRVHAENWGEAPVGRYPDEGERMVAVGELVLELLAGGARVVALQEVSGDLRAHLRRVVGRGVQLFDHTYARVPRMKSGHSRSLVDPSEHLVTLVEGAAEIAFARDAPDDRGKGVLAVRFDGWTVMSTHVTGGGHGGRQLALLAGEASACAGPVVLVGDFNADAATVRSAFPTPFQVADPTGTLPTRVAGGGVPGQWIDHVVTRGARVEELEVVDGALRSDHNPVRALVVPS